jgi:hypothetical protein
VNTRIKRVSGRWIAPPVATERAVLSEGAVPPGAALRFEIELTRVSVPPS